MIERDDKESEMSCGYVPLLFFSKGYISSIILVTKCPQTGLPNTEGNIGPHDLETSTVVRRQFMNLSSDRSYEFTLKERQWDLEVL